MDESDVERWAQMLRDGCFWCFFFFRHMGSLHYYVYILLAQVLNLRGCLEACSYIVKNQCELQAWKILHLELESVVWMPSEPTTMFTLYILDQSTQNKKITI